MYMRRTFYTDIVLYECAGSECSSQISALSEQLSDFSERCDFGGKKKNRHTSDRLTAAI